MRPDPASPSSCSLYDVLKLRTNYTAIGVTKNDTCPNTSFAGWVQFPNGVMVCGVGWPATSVVRTSLTNANYILMFDLYGDVGSNLRNAERYYANFNPSGDFDGPGLSQFDVNTLGKSFLWPHQDGEVFTCCNYPPTGGNSGLNLNNFKQIGDYLAQ